MLSSILAIVFVFRLGLILDFDFSDYYKQQQIMMPGFITIIFHLKRFLYTHRHSVYHKIRKTLIPTEN